MINPEKHPTENPTVNEHRVAVNTENKILSTSPPKPKRTFSREDLGAANAIDIQEEVLNFILDEHSFSDPGPTILSRVLISCVIGSLQRQHSTEEVGVSQEYSPQQILLSPGCVILLDFMSEYCKKSYLRWLNQAIRLNQPEAVDIDLELAGYSHLRIISDTQHSHNCALLLQMTPSGHIPAPWNSNNELLLKISESALTDIKTACSILQQLKNKKDGSYATVLKKLLQSCDSFPLPISQSPSGKFRRIFEKLNQLRTNLLNFIAPHMWRITLSSTASPIANKLANFSLKRQEGQVEGIDKIILAASIVDINNNKNITELEQSLLDDGAHPNEIKQFIKILNALVNRCNQADRLIPQQSESDLDWLQTLYRLAIDIDEVLKKYQKLRQPGQNTLDNSLSTPQSSQSMYTPLKNEVLKQEISQQIQHNKQWPYKQNSPKRSNDEVSSLSAQHALDGDQVSSSSPTPSNPSNQQTPINVRGIPSSPKKPSNNIVVEANINFKIESIKKPTIDQSSRLKSEPDHNGCSAYSGPAQEAGCAPTSETIQTAPLEDSTTDNKHRSLSTDPTTPSDKTEVKDKQEDKVDSDSAVYKANPPVQRLECVPPKLKTEPPLDLKDSSMKGLIVELMDNTISSMGWFASWSDKAKTLRGYKNFFAKAVEPTTQVIVDFIRETLKRRMNRGKAAPPRSARKLLELLKQDKYQKIAKSSEIAKELYRIEMLSFMDEIINSMGYGSTLSWKKSMLQYYRAGAAQNKDQDKETNDLILKAFLKTALSWRIGGTPKMSATAKAVIQFTQKHPASPLTQELERLIEKLKKETNTLEIDTSSNDSIPVFRPQINQSVRKSLGIGWFHRPFPRHFLDHCREANQCSDSGAQPIVEAGISPDIPSLR